MKEGISGTFFYPQTVEALVEAVRGFDDSQYDPQQIAQEAKRFDVSVFKEQLMAFV